METKEYRKVREPAANEKISAVVSDVKEMLASEIFGDAAIDPSKHILVVTVEGTDGFSMAIKTDLTMTLIEPPSKKSKLWAWKTTYGDYPKPGQSVNLRFDAEARRWKAILN